MLEGAWSYGLRRRRKDHSALMVMFRALFGDANRPEVPQKKRHSVWSRRSRPSSLRLWKPIPWIQGQTRQ